RATGATLSALRSTTTQILSNAMSLACLSRLDDLQLLEEGHDLLVTIPLVDDDLTGLTSLGRLHRGDLLTGTGGTHDTRLEAQIGHLDLVDRLAFGGHDALEGGVTGLDHTSRDRDEGRKRHLDLVIAGLGLALDVDLALRHGHLFGKSH